MISLKDIPVGAYKLLLVMATIIWGLSFVLMKNAVEVLPTGWLLGVRFVMAGLILLVVLWRRVRRLFSRDALLAGMLLGVFDFSAFWAQTVGLEHTTPGVNAFLTATYCVIVPFLWWVITRKRPTVFNIGAAVLAVLGIWMVSSASAGSSAGVGGAAGASAASVASAVGLSFSMGLGEGMTLLGAFLFAVHIVFVSKFTKKHDALMLTVFQFLTEGVLGCLVGVGFETFPPLSAITPSLVASVAFLAVFASVVAFGIQNVALAYVPPSQASLFLSLESVFGVLFSVLLYGEQVGLRLIIGFALIFVAIVVSEAFPVKRKGCKGSEEARGAAKMEDAVGNVAECESEEATRGAI